MFNRVEPELEINLLESTKDCPELVQKSNQLIFEDL